MNIDTTQLDKISNTFISVFENRGYRFKSKPVLTIEEDERGVGINISDAGGSIGRMDVEQKNNGKVLKFTGQVNFFSSLASDRLNIQPVDFWFEMDK
jgi:hypothetical protein